MEHADGLMCLKSCKWFDVLEVMQVLATAMLDCEANSIVYLSRVRLLYILKSSSWLAGWPALKKQYAWFAVQVARARHSCEAW